jgi:hypothetical protein
MCVAKDQLVEAMGELEVSPQNLEEPKKVFLIFLRVGGSSREAQQEVQHRVRRS